MRTVNFILIVLFTTCICSNVNAANKDIAQNPKPILKQVADEKNEAELLSILNNLDTQLETIEQVPQQHKNDDQFLQSKEPIELLDEALLLEDNLEDLAIDEALSSELTLLELNQEHELQLTESLQDQKGTPPEQLSPTPAATKGVGIQGGEELLINTLDDSTLIDIDKELEKLEKKLKHKQLDDELNLYEK
ncbi:hypothetical protein PA25_17600 [Pseudoalteromonas sp. A25]|uniref:hypothetical protein n=1 Tax=Pseudoalteromonas sp. A25 TaxID=116092 RepID=UPI001260C1AF|nr:hypothetical protein [Pseudoalteromonas sp. A25]BBN81775.1 hypothetical protein PA25_17600 [Pseudoalteromonas sp. A25]